MNSKPLFTAIEMPEVDLATGATAEANRRRNHPRGMPRWLRPSSKVAGRKDRCKGAFQAQAERPLPTGRRCLIGLVEPRRAKVSRRQVKTERRHVARNGVQLSE